MQKHLGLEDFAHKVLAWYRAHAEILPWRVQPGLCADVYAVWVSEIMLQQTTVSVVQRYYPRFIRRFPTVEAMAKAPLQEVLAFWAGLGYYRRAHNMHQCAQEVMTRYGGVWPSCVKELKTLPGIGDYTAGAIRAIALQKPAVAADTNVLRVCGRALGMTPAQVRESLDSLHLTFPGDFYQGLMDIGRLMCGKKRASCARCPLAVLCVARKNGQELLQAPQARCQEKKPVKYACFFVFKKAQKYYFCQGTPEGSMLAGLWIFPSTAWMSAKEFQAMRQEWPPSLRQQTHAPALRHTFSHFTLVAYMAGMADASPAQHYEGQWLGEGITAYPLSSLAQKLLRAYKRKVV